MGVEPRSTRTAGRTGDRPAGGRVPAVRSTRLVLLPCVVLLTVSALGAAQVTALDATGDVAPSPQAPTPEPTAVATPIQIGTPPAATPAPAETASPAPEATASPASEPEPAASAAPAAPAAPPEASATSPAGDPPAEPAASPTPEPPADAPGDSGAPPAPSTAAVAQNVSTVFQVLWQVQQGCQSYCYGTSQAQTGEQAATTTQAAAADAAGDDSGAVATNTSKTVQFLWQYQVGCLAFCYGTALSQAALQSAQTAQLATAVATLGALALNVAETLQLAWQIQKGCEQECHGATETQTIVQVAATSQDAQAGSAAGPLALPGDVMVAPELPAWLIALAANVGATIETIYQLQEAACLTNCTGGAQVQEGVQRASVVQLAIAVAGVREPDAPVTAGGADPPAVAPTVQVPPVTPAADPGTGSARPPSIAAASGGSIGSWAPPARAHQQRRGGKRPQASRRVATAPGRPPYEPPGAGTRQPAASPPPGDPTRRPRPRVVLSTPTETVALPASPVVPVKDAGIWRLVALLSASLALVAVGMTKRRPLPENGGGL